MRPQWFPTPLDLEWTKNLYSKLNPSNGKWEFSTGEYGGEMSKTTATFTRIGDKMVITNINIHKEEDKELLFNRIEQSKICFECLGIECDISSPMGIRRRR
jgi:hypothetical protein